MDDIMEQLSVKRLVIAVVAMQMRWVVHAIAGEMWRTDASVAIQLHHIHIT